MKNGEKTKAPLLKLLPQTYDLIVELVPEEVSIQPGRYQIVSIRIQGNEVVARYKIPGQWSAEEASILAQEIRGTGWQLLDDEDFCGRPHGNEEIQLICEQFCKEIS
ncbi:MAG TPA: hypothetical protein V6D33_07115 [Cyanophyceae cyanobacterium]